MPRRSLTLALLVIVAVVLTGCLTGPGGAGLPTNDGNIQWDGLFHDSFDSTYRSPFGAMPAGAQVTLGFRTARFDVDAVSLRVYQYDPESDSTAAPADYALTYRGDRAEGGATYALWTYTLTAPSRPAILYYKFQVSDQGDVDWYGDAYADDHDNLGQGGPGAPAEDEPFAAFQITVYDPAFVTPEWLRNATVYQIFPDRFRNGDPGNDYCRPGASTGCPTFYGSEQASAHTTWNEAICDPRGTACPGAYGSQFYGGDLRGIVDRLDYLQSLGVDTLYLTPIVKGRSNHRYDTEDYLATDPALGGDAAFAGLVEELGRRGMRVILDGVFNHTSSDSLYFDRYGRYTGAEGACESTGSPYRAWYEFSGDAAPCQGGDYTGWFGYESLAVLRDDGAGVRDFIYRASDSVMAQWYARGAAGWRFDVADEISHGWWRDFRPYAKGYSADGPLVGEVWYDASKFLLGDQLDAVMNYRFRKSVLGFARDSADWGDNDSNGANRIAPLAPSQLDHALRAIREDYPPQATLAMLNLLGSHDTNRALYVLTLQGDHGLAEAKERLRLAALLQLTYMGAPMIYYGDEAGLNSPSLANGNNGPEDDPYNRAPYPWTDEAGDVGVYGPPDDELIAYYGLLGGLRRAHAALRTGAFTTLLIGDTSPAQGDEDTYAYARGEGEAAAVVALNQGGGANTATVPVGAYFPDGAVLRDALSGESYTVGGGAVTLTLAPRGGALLLRQP